jgi:hypothetical protein
VLEFADPQPTVTAIVPDATAGTQGINIKPPAPPAPAKSFPPAPPPATTNTCAKLVVPDGTAKVPDDVNDVDVNVLFTVIEYALLDVFEAASTALNVKFVVVFAVGFVGVPVILNFDTPSSVIVADDKPPGKEPD